MGRSYPAAYQHRLAQARRATGLSQRALADAVGMDRTAVAKIESGRRGVASLTAYHAPFEGRNVAKYGLGLCLFTFTLRGRTSIATSPFVERARVASYRQVTYAHLLAIVRHRGSLLATFDRGIKALLPPEIDASSVLLVLEASN